MPQVILISQKLAHRPHSAGISKMASKLMLARMFPVRCTTQLTTQLRYVHPTPSYICVPHHHGPTPRSSTAVSVRSTQSAVECRRSSTGSNLRMVHAQMSMNVRGPSEGGESGNQE